MLVIIRQKIRALVEDFILKCTPELFIYSNSNIFKLCANNVTEIIQVLVNGNPLPSGDDFTFNSATNEVTVNTALSTGDQVEITYNCTKWSDSELDEYIRAALVWLSIFSFCADEDFELEEDEIFPTPTNQEQDLIALVASILIKPDFSEYRLPNLTIKYPRTMTKEKRIEELISKFRRGLGTVAIIEWDDRRC